MPNSSEAEILVTYWKFSNYQFPFIDDARADTTFTNYVEIKLIGSTSSYLNSIFFFISVLLLRSAVEHFRFMFQALECKAGKSDNKNGKRIATPHGSTAILFLVVFHLPPRFKRENAEKRKRDRERILIATFVLKWKPPYFLLRESASALSCSRIYLRCFLKASEWNSST